MEQREITKSVLESHESVERLRKVIIRAIVDGRFKMTLADHRKLRDLIDDMELMLNKSWLESMKIPVELPVVGKMQEITIKK